MSPQAAGSSAGSSSQDPDRPSASGGLLRLSMGGRVVAATVAAAAATPLAVAWRLEPDSAGVGTHQQLGLPACGWMSGMNLPCPSCGMTTSFSLAVRGELLAAMQAQPMGALLALAAAVAVVVAGFTAATGSRSYELLGSLLGGRAVWVGLVLAALAWVYKIAAVRLDGGAMP